MALSLTTPGVYMILNIAGKTAMGIRGTPTNYNPAQGFYATMPPQGLDPTLLWALSSAPGGYYSLYNAWHPNCLTATSWADGSTIDAEPCGSGNNQLWNITAHPTFQGPTYYTMVNKATGMIADLNSGNTAAGTPIQSRNIAAGNPNQAWLFILGS